MGYNPINPPPPFAKPNLDIRLTKKQGEIFGAFSDPVITEILLGGGGRGGKTRGVAEIIIATSFAYPGIVWLVGRKELDDLKKTTLATLFKAFHDHKLVRKTKPNQVVWHYSVNLSDKTIEFSSGSKIYLLALKRQPTDIEYNWIGGYEGTHVFVDEAQEVERKAIDVLNSRKTEKIDEYGIVGKTLLSCNPQKGHLYADFIKPSRDGTLDPSRIFIQSLYTDNPYINHEKYAESLRKANKATKERLLKGNWEYDDNPYKLMEYDAILDLFTNAGKKTGEKYITGDMARMGGDRIVVSVWDGWVEIERYVWTKQKTDITASKIREIANHHGIPMRNVLVDEDGVGGGVRDMLGCKGFLNGSSPIQPPKVEKAKDEDKNAFKVAYSNLKAQCYDLLAQKVNGTDEIRLVDSEDRELVIEELDAISREKPDEEKVFYVTDKKKMKELIGRSPDFADTVMMRVYFDLMPKKTVFVGTF